MKNIQLVALLILVFVLAACNLPGSAGTPTATLSAEQLVQTALAQTAEASGGDPDVATSVAGTLLALSGGEQLSATLPGAEPSDTLQPTDVPTETPSIPIIHVSVNTNCRYGPGLVYDPPVNTFSVGETAQVFGRSPDSSFYFIDKGCYVWNNFVTVEAGNIGAVPIYTPPPEPTATPTEEPLPWAGTWNTNCAEGDCDQMILEQVGNAVTGTYANGAGLISGTVNGNHLSGSWARGGTGSIDFWMNGAENRWHGNFNRSESWCGAREGLGYLNPCLVSSWYGTWSTNCQPASCLTMHLTQNGTSVSGDYASGAGTVNGTVSGKVFSGTWERGGGSGSFTFYLQIGGTQFRGNHTTFSQWCGRRDGDGFPGVCLQN